MKILVTIGLFLASGGIFINEVAGNPMGSPPPTIICPDDITVDNDVGECSAVVYYTPPDSATLIAGLPSGSPFPVGVTVNTFILDGDTITCSFTVTVWDTEPPVITCPDDFTVSYDASLCQVVYYDPPVATDNCSAGPVTQTSGLASGSIFPTGITINTFEVEDASGNMVTCSFRVTVTGEHITALPGDGSSSQQVGPQGHLRYQRQFFLITPGEMQESGITGGMELNSIGFTIGAAQGDTAMGTFQVYLENTTDTVARTDTNWLNEISSTASYHAGSLPPGNYEWQVRSICTDSSGYSGPVSFSNEDLGGCNQPYNLATSDISDVSATFSWECPPSQDFEHFLIEYSISLSDDWNSFYTTDTFYIAGGLNADTNYQWRVRTICTQDSSPYSAASFATESPLACDTPYDLMTDNITDTTVDLSWAELNDVTYYSIQYRRSGTLPWYSAISFVNEYTIKDLPGGTIYEWRLRSLCDEGNSAYVPGPSFTTPGDLVCYKPAELVTKDITSSGATFTWEEVPGATAYKIRYRLKESIAWSNAIAQMTMVSDSKLTVTDTIGPYDVPFASGNPFTYSGGGIYVAWEFSRPGGQLTSPNITLGTGQNTTIKDINGQDSITYILCLSGKSDTSSNSLPEILSSSRLRPEVRFGSPDMADSVEVTNVYAMGNVALPFGSPTEISALVKNFSGAEKTYQVTLTIKEHESGDLRHGEIQSITLPANCGDIVNFNAWTPTDLETDSIIVSIPAQPGENVTENNSDSYLQKVNQTLISYSDGSNAIDGAGYDLGEGLILDRLYMNGCGLVNSAQVYLHYSAAQHAVYAVVLDSTGNILGSSDPFIPDSTEVNAYYAFYFPNMPQVTDAWYYIGLAQTASTSTGYFPVGVQYESAFIRSGAYYRAGIDGSDITDYPYPGRLMIRAEVLPAIPLPKISGGPVLCQGESITLQATSKETRFANRLISFSSQFSNSKYNARQVLGTPNVYPEYSSSVGSWISSTSDSQREYIELGYSDSAPVNFIEIYETFNPGAIDTVYVKDPGGNLVVVYADSLKTLPQEARINRIEFPTTSFDVTEIRLAVNSPEVSGFNAIDAVGIGMTLNPATYDNYTWEPGGETTPSITVSSPGTVNLTVYNNSGCSAETEINIETPVATTPVISAEGPTTFCEGETVTLTSDQTGGNTWNTGDTTQSIVVDTSGIYFVSYDNGCEVLTSDEITVEVHPTPQVTITGGSICPGSYTLLGTEIPYTTYEWSTGETTPTIEVYSPGVVSVEVTDENGCQGSASINVFLAPAPAPFISGNPWYCPGDSTLLSAGQGYSSYLWSNGATTPSIYASAEDTYSVTVTNIYGCSGSTSVETHQYSPPSPFISGTLSLCAGTTTVLDAGTGYVSYLWSTGETSHSIIVDTADTFTVIVTDGNGCQGVASATTTLDGMLPETPGPITGPDEGLCFATRVVYSIDPVPNTTHYVWTLPPEATITSGQGTTTITVDFASFFTGQIIVAASNACGQSPTWNERILTVEGSPGSPSDISGETFAVCGQSDLSYHIDEVAGATNYTWIVPEGSSISGGQGTNSILVSFDDSFVSGDICVTANSACGDSEPVCMLVNGVPGQPPYIDGLAEVCQSQEGVQYTIDPVPGATSYTWTVPWQAEIIYGQGTTEIMVNFGTKSGSVAVAANNTCGSSETTALQVSVIKCNNPDGIGPFAGDYNEGSNDPAQNDIPAHNQFIFAQEIIASAGGFEDGMGSTLSWTLGEPIIETVYEQENYLTQGFQQSLYQIVAIDEGIEDLSYKVNIYPVPAVEKVFIVITSFKEPVNMVVEIFDMIGTRIYSNKVQNKYFKDEVPLEQYPSDMFLLKVSNTVSNTAKSFKILKINVK